MDGYQGGILRILGWLVWFAEGQERKLGGILIDCREEMVEVNWKIPSLC